MRVIGAFLFNLMLLAVSSAQDKPAQADAAYIISDLNAISPMLVGGNLTRADVSEIAAFSCSTFRVAARAPDFAEATRQLSEAPYPSDEIAKLDQSEFVKTELELFAQNGASADTLTLAEEFLLKEPMPRADNSLELGDLAVALATAEEVSCEARTRVVDEMVAVGPRQNEASFARAMTKGVIGVGIIALDTALVIEGGPGGALIFGVLSVGSTSWGWDRTKEASEEMATWWKELQNER